VAYNPLNALPLEAVLLRAFVWMPLDTAIEEISFAALLARSAATGHHASSRAALGWVFTLWHLVIVSRTCSLPTSPIGAAHDPGSGGRLWPIFVGGVLFAVLRLRRQSRVASSPTGRSTPCCSSAFTPHL
jgi:hypothetical protein